MNKSIQGIIITLCALFLSVAILLSGAVGATPNRDDSPLPTPIPTWTTGPTPTGEWWIIDTPTPEACWPFCPTATPQCQPGDECPVGFDTPTPPPPPASQSGWGALVYLPVIVR